MWMYDFTCINIHLFYHCICKVLLSSDYTRKCNIANWNANCSKIGFLHISACTCIEILLHFELVTCALCMIIVITMNYVITKSIIIKMKNKTFDSLRNWIYSTQCLDDHNHDNDDDDDATSVADVKCPKTIYRSELQVATPDVVWSVCKYLLIYLIA